MNAASERLSAALSGRYRIERELGAGGMATVYLAEDLKHDRKVAIKVLKPELAAVLGAERFVVEIKTTAAMSHPHILPLFDSGTADGFLFYVMPYIEGETIREKLNRETQFGVDDAVRIAREVADALDYAHRHGVIHRDIKPENILLHDGRAMVMDFGIALAVSAAAGGRMTETGLSLGTPHYMSPEQATAEKEITPRSDVYSLAAVLYEMLTGNPPFTGAAAQQVIMKIITASAEPVTKYRKSVPPNVATAVAQALEKLPADRFENAKAFGEALGNSGYTHATTGEPPAAVRPAAGAARFVPWAVAAVAVVIAAVFATRDRGESSGARMTAAIIPLEIRTPSDVPLNEVGVPVSISRDGSFIVFVGADPEQRGATALWRRSLDRLDAVPIPGTRGANAPVISADGKSIFFLVRSPRAISNRARVIPVDGGVAQDPLSAEQARLPARDGRLYLRGTDSLIHIVSRDRPLPAGVRPLAEVRGAVDVSPDGRLIASSSAGVSRDSILIGPPDAKFVFLTRGMSPRFLDDRTLAYRSLDGTLMVARLDAARTRLAGTPLALIPGIAQTGDEHAIYDVAADGTLIYAPGGAAGLSRLVWVKPDGKETPVPGAVPRVYAGVSLAPDGRRAVTTVGSLLSGDLWLEDIASGTRSPVTSDGYNTRPAWSSDGRRLAFVRTTGTAGGGRAVLEQTVDRDVPPDTVPGGTFKGAMIGEFQWSPDGKSAAIRITGRATQGRDVFVRLPGAKEWTPFAADSKAQERGPRFSPDGKWLLYVSDRSGREEVYVEAFPSGGSRVQVSADGGREALWSRDGSKIFFRSLDGWMNAATISRGPPLAVAKRERLFDASAYHTNQFLTMYDVAPDGRFLMLKRDAETARTDLVVIRGWVQQVMKRLDAAKQP
ncbi:MAG: protein kinase [Gemmatimonadales bacterium]